MQYKSGFNHQLYEDESFRVPFYAVIDTQFIKLDSFGLMTLKKGFAWNGADFIIDRKTNLTASAFHDALYRLMRKKLLNHKDWRLADGVFAELLERAGAWKVTIKLDMIGLKIANGSAANPENKDKVYTAP